MGWGRHWFKEPKPEKPERRGPFTLFKDASARKQRAEAIFSNRARLEEAARLLRLSNECYCLQSATLVDAAIEVLDQGLQNLCRDKPRDRYKDPNAPDET